MASSTKAILAGNIPSIADILDDTMIGDIVNIIAPSLLTETVNDLTISTLLTKGLYDPAARKSAIIAAEGDMEVYSATYHQTKRSYRRGYSAAKLKTLGYLPSSTAVTYALDIPAVLTYVQDNYNSTITSVISLREGAAAIDDVVYFNLQSNVEWDSTTGEWTADAGTHYEYDSSVKVNATDIDTLLIRNPIETIEDNLITHYSYNGVDEVTLPGPDKAYTTSTTTSTGCTNLRLSLDTVDFYNAAVVEDTTYLVDTPAKPAGDYTVDVYETISGVESLTTSYIITIITDEVYNVNTAVYTIDGTQYVTECTLVSDGTTVTSVYTDIESITKTTPSALFDTETMHVRCGTGVDDILYYIEDLSTIPSDLRTEVVIDVTAIVPIKESGVFVDSDDASFKKMMSLLNIEPTTIFDSLTDDRLQDAYMLYGIPLDTADPSCYKALFKTFNLVQGDNVSVDISVPGLNIRYQYQFNRSETVGSIGAVGTYTKSIYTVGVLNEYVMQLKWQVTTEEYITIEVSNYEQTFSIGGVNYRFDLNAKADEARILLPLSVLKGLKYRDFCNVHEESLALAMYSREVVEIKWYETSLFQNILMIVGIVITIVTQQYWVVAAIIAAKFVVDELVARGIISGEVGLILQTIIAIIAIWYGGAGEGAGLLFQAVNTGIAIGNAYVSYEMQQLMDDAAAYENRLDEFIEKGDEIREENGEFVDSTQSYLAQFHFDMDFATEPPDADENIAHMCYMANGYMVEQPQHLFELDSKFDRVKNVYAGP